MSTFAIERIELVDGPIKFYKLWIDDYCQFNEFLSELENGGSLSQIEGLFRRITEVGQMRRLPQNKFKEITPEGQLVKEYEIKCGVFRVYLIKHEGHIVIIGGKKNRQEKDIRQFRSIKKRYLESLKHIT